MHYRLTSGWVNEGIRIDHENLVSTKEAQTRCATSSPGGSTSVDETYILKKVLGESHGHIRERGCTLKGGTSLGGRCRRQHHMRPNDLTWIIRFQRGCVANAIYKTNTLTCKS